MRSSARISAAFLLATGLCSCSLMDFDGLASGPEGLGGAGGLGLDNGGGATSGTPDAGRAGSSAGTAGSGPVAPTNLIANPGFEEIPARWIAVGGCSLALSSDSPHQGNSCLLTSNRAENWQGPGYDLTFSLQPNATYRATIWARVADGSQPMQLTYKHHCEAETEDTFTPFSLSTRVSTDWTELSAFFVAADCKAVQSLIYVEGPAAGAEFYIDDTSVVLEAL
jgi:hypothetical protein